MKKIVFLLTFLVLSTAFVVDFQKVEPLVIVFTRDNCEACENVVGLFESENITVDERNISKYPLYRKEMFAKLATIGWNNTKIPVMPVIETEEKLYTNGEKVVAEILAKLNPDASQANTTTPPVPPKILVDNTTSGGDAEPANMKGLVARHNYWRSQLKLPPLVWSDKMAKLAQDWADNLARQGCKMEHRPNNKFGENIYWSSGMKSTPQNVTDSWADEQKDFNFTTLECNGAWYKCGHYTQLIWETTTSVGCGMAKCGNQEIWVCNYDPPGNWTGQKPYKKK